MKLFVKHQDGTVIELKEKSYKEAMRTLKNIMAHPFYNANPIKDISWITTMDYMPFREE